MSIFRGVRGAERMRAAALRVVYAASLCALACGYLSQFEFRRTTLSVRRSDALEAAATVPRMFSAQTALNAKKRAEIDSNGTQKQQRGKGRKLQPEEKQMLDRLQEISSLVQQNSNPAKRTQVLVTKQRAPAEQADALLVGLKRAPDNPPAPASRNAVEEGISQLLAEVRAYRQQLTLQAKSRTVSAPGRVDLTGLRAFAIDLPGTHIYEDAISYNATSKELLVHIPEVAPWFQKCCAIHRQAGHTVSSVGSILPRKLLRALAFSSRSATNAVTAIIALDGHGKIKSTRVVPSVVNKVIPFTFTDAQAVLDEALLEQDEYLANKRRQPRRTLLADTLLKWWAFYQNYPFAPMETLPVSKIIHAALAVFSQAATKYCRDAGVAVWCHRRGLETGVGITRFGRAPLRDTVAMLQQYQLLSALDVVPRLTSQQWQVEQACLTALSSGKNQVSRL